MANYEVYFSNAGVPATGLTLTWKTLKKYSDGTDESSQPAFTEIGGGWYKFSYSPSETMIGVVDGSATLGDTDRYIPCKFTTDDGVIAVTGDLMGLTDDAIKASKFDESTAFPVKSADSGSTQIARVGADGDTLETLSDQIDGTATPAEVNTEVSDVLKVDTISEMAVGVPPATPTFQELMMYLYMVWRNAGTANGSTLTVKNDAGATIAKASLSDDGTTFTKSEFISG